MDRTNPTSRREFLATTVATGAAAAMSGTRKVAEAAAVRGAERLGKAEHCIFIWLGGGMGQIDTFDPSPQMGDPAKGEGGSYYKRIPTAVRDVYVCEHLSRVAKVMDRCSVIRTVHHDVGEHGSASHRMHIGRPTTGSIVYPSVGSIISYLKGDGGEGVPRYVLVGYPSPARGPGFLGAEGNYFYVTDADSGPAVLKRAREVGANRRKRREAMRQFMRNRDSSSEADQMRADYEALVAESARLAGPTFMGAFDLESEPAALRESYGSEFGQRCLLARRLVERGTRFIEVSHNLNFVNGTGWDVHNEGIVNQHLLIEELDSAMATLIRDLEKRNLLEKTLIVVSTEFGRPPTFDGGGGRGHQWQTFSVVMAGGGIRGGVMGGETDELAQQIVSRPVSVPDLFATKFAAMGLNPRTELFADDRPVPISDNGRPVTEILA